jgi:thioredoxin-related protein
VKIDEAEHKDIIKDYAVTSFPTVIILDSNGEVLRRAEEYTGIAGMIDILSKKEKYS